MKSKYLGYALGIALGIGIALAPEPGDAFYVSQKEAQKAGIKTSEITKTKLPMGDKVSYKGSLENDETFYDIADRVQNEAEDFFGTDFSKEITRKALASFNSYRKVEMPLVSVPCKYQFVANYLRELEKGMRQRGKSEALEKDLEFLKGKLGELENLYEHDISDLMEKYTDHEKRIKELENRPGQKDYSSEVEQLKEETEELREMLESKEGGYAQPPATEGYGSSGGVIFGEREWFPGLPYPYFVLGTSIYCGVPFGNSFYWNHWGWLDDWGYGFRARGLNGRIFDYHGPRSLFRDYSGYQRLPDGKRWKGREKDPDPRGRGHVPGRLPDLRDRRLQGKTRNDGRFDQRGFQKGEAPRMHEGRRNSTMGRQNIPRQEYRGSFQRGQIPNQQFNRGMQNRGPQGGGNFQNFQRGQQHITPGRGFGQGAPAGQSRSGGRGRQ